MKARGDKIDGWLVLDKPIGPSSAAAVARVRRLMGAAKAGHAGTLDPLASGVLPIALGEATKTVRYAVDAAKTYLFTVRWGEARASDDAEGAVVATSEIRPQDFAIRAILARFTGEILQAPPAYSAIMVGGVRAYARARAGESLTLAERKVRVDRLELVELPDRERARFRVECGKGVYIRSLARDLARALGTLGYVAELRRTAVGRFTEELAIPLAKLEGLGHSAARFGYLRPVETALDDIPALAVTEAECTRLRRGQTVGVSRMATTLPQEPGAHDPSGHGVLTQGQVVCVTHLGRAVALAAYEGETLRPLRVLNL